MKSLFSTWMWLVLFGSMTCVSGWAGCPVHPNAWTASPGIQQVYADGDRWHGDGYYGVRAAEKDAEGLRNRDGWILGRLPVRPYFLPYSDDDVRVVTAWVYPKDLNESVHSGIDFARSDDAAFAVRAAAEGWVVWVGRGESTGPVIIIDHGGLRSIYHLHKGSVDVREGEWVDAKQPIGRASPYLHFAVAAPGERVAKVSATYGEVTPEQLWTFLDPFGLYGGSESLGCYNNDDGLRSGMQYPSLFAPSPPDFLDLDDTAVTRAYQYYSRFKWFPWTLSISTDSNGWYASGSYHPEAVAPPAAAVFRTTKDLEQDIRQKADKGYQLGQLSGAVDASGQARFAEVFWAARPFVTKQWMTPGAFLEEFEAQIKKQWVLTQYLPQLYDKELRITATWTKLEPFRNQAAFYGLTEQEFQQKNDELSKQGFDLVDLLRFRTEDGASRIAGLWHTHMDKTSYKSILGVAPEAFAETVARAKRSGYGVWRLHRSESGVDLVLAQSVAQPRPDLPQAKEPTFDKDRVRDKLKGDLVVPGAVEGGAARSMVSGPAKTPIRIEGEYMGKDALLTDGKLVPGDMTPFKGDWSNQAVLLWVNAKEGARMTLRLEAPTAGYYNMKVRYTLGMNFGIFRNELYGRAVGPDLDGYAEKVQASPVVDLGRVQLVAGRNDLVVVIRGKNPNATAMTVGIDYYEITPE